jgi:ornithine cyclodeaminase/alanine dehydrogenase-like protein (mu-crystallin family)
VPELLILGRADVERLLDPAALLDALEDAFRAVSEGRASVPPRIASMAPAGFVGVMPAWLPGTLEVKLVAVFAGNHEHGLPSHQALIALFDEATGTPLAVLDGTHVTAVRTAAGSAVATRLLAREEAGVLAILGAGVQGRSHLELVGALREWEEIRVGSREPAHAEALAGTHRRARACASFEEAVRGADVVCCCTDALEPILEPAWVAPGAHVNSVGGSTRGRGELPPQLCQEGALFLESRTTFQPPPAGAPELAGLDPAGAAELGEVLLGTRPGRVSAEQVTVYKSVGHAVEDACAAALVYRRALEEGAGIRVSI